MYLIHTKTRTWIGVGSIKTLETIDSLERQGESITKIINSDTKEVVTKEDLEDLAGYHNDPTWLRDMFRF